MFEMNEVIALSSYARGNENNAYAADGVYYLGPGVSPGYAITNFRAHYDLTRHLQLTGLCKSSHLSSASVSTSIPISFRNSVHSGRMGAQGRGCPLARPSLDYFNWCWGGRLEMKNPR
jgi:hypothetical protein